MGMQTRFQGLEQQINQKFANVLVPDLEGVRGELATLWDAIEKNMKDHSTYLVIDKIYEKEVSDIVGTGTGKVVKKVGGERQKNKTKRSKKSDIMVVKTSSVDSAWDHKIRVHYTAIEVSSS